MSPFQMLVGVTTVSCVCAIGSASAQVSDSPSGPTDHTTRTVPKSILTFEASGGFAGILDELLILPDGRTRASRLLLGQRQVRWSVLGSTETATLNQAVAALFPVPGKHGSGSGTMLWKIARVAKDKSQQFTTSDDTAHGRHVIRWMSALHQSVLRHGFSSHLGGIGLPSPSLDPGTDAVGRVIGRAGPAVAPVGDTIQIGITNDTRHPITLPNPAPFQVRDVMGRVVYAPVSPAVLVRVAPGETHRMTWDQVDDEGQLLPAGSYFVEFTTLGLPTVKIQTVPVSGTGG